MVPLIRSRGDASRSLFPYNSSAPTGLRSHEPPCRTGSHAHVWNQHRESATLLCKWLSWRLWLFHLTGWEDYSQNRTAERGCRFQGVYTEICFAGICFWKHMTDCVGNSPEVTRLDKVDRNLAAWTVQLRLRKLEDKLTEILRRKLSVLNSMWFAKDTQEALARHKQKPESQLQTTKRSTMPNDISLGIIRIWQGKIWNQANLEAEGVAHLVQCLLLFIRSQV